MPRVFFNRKRFLMTGGGQGYSDGQVFSNDQGYFDGQVFSDGRGFSDDTVFAKALLRPRY